MSLNSNALTTVANLKSYLGITSATYDTLLEIFINGSSEWIENECGGRAFLKPASDVQELHDGDFDGTGQNKIFTKQWPIVSLTSIEYRTGDLESPTWNVLDASNYTKDDAAGIIYVLGRLSVDSISRQNIRLNYQGGFATAPSDLELACLKLSAKEFDKRRSQGATNESVGGGSVAWNEAVDPSVTKIISKYRRF